MSNLYDSVLLVNYLHKQYGKNLKGLFDKENRKQAEKVFLSAIREFSENDYSESRPLFTEGVRGERRFAPEMMDLEHIESLTDLYDTIYYLKDTWYYVNEADCNSERVDKESDEFPKQVEKVTKDNVLTFLRDSHQIHKEEDFCILGEEDSKKILYDMYQTFTGCLLKEDDREFFLVCKHKDNVFDYPFYTEFFHGSEALLKHITYMKAIKANLYLRELEDAEKRKQLRISQLFGKEKSQELER